MRKLIIAVPLALGVAAIGIGVFLQWQVLPYLKTPMQTTGKPFYYDFSSGSNLRQVVMDLAKKQVLDKPDYLLLYAKVNDRARSLKSGIYRIDPKRQSPLDMLEMLQQGGVAQFRFRTQEGRTFQRMMQRVRKNQDLIHTLQYDTPDDVMVAIGEKGKPYEGQFYPDTYALPYGYTDIDFLKQSYQKQQKVLKEEWQQRAEGLKLANAYETLILASIIEKETANDAERFTISGVFHNRLNKGMRLQTDPTVIYGMGEAFKGNITRKDLRTKTPYNTYINSCIQL